MAEFDINIEGLAPRDPNINDYIIKGEIGGIAYKTTIQKLQQLLNTIGVSSYRGVLLIADSPTEDGIYIAGESGTYINTNNLVVNLVDNLTFIDVSSNQTVFNKVEIPLSTPSINDVFVGTDNINGATMLAISNWLESLKAKAIYLDDGLINSSQVFNYTKLLDLLSREYINGKQATTEAQTFNSLNNGFLNSSGVFTSSDNWRTTNFINVSSGDKFFYSGFTQSSARAVVGYDENDNFVSILVGLTNSQYFNHEVTIPSNVSKVKASSRMLGDNGDTFSFRKITETDKIGNIPAFVSNIGSILSENLTVGVHYTSGVLDASFTNWRTDIVDVSNIKEVEYTGQVSVNSVGVYPVLGFDSNGDYVSTLLGQNNNRYTNEVLSIPSNITTIYVNYRALSSDVQELTGKQLDNQKDITINNEIVYKINKSWAAIGHSIWFFDNRGDASYAGGTKLRGIQTLVQEEIEFTNVSKYAYSGNSLGGLTNGDGSSILSDSNSWVSHDIFTYDSITNDFKRNIPIGTTSDFLNNTGRTTYYGALRQLHDILLGLNADYRMICANALKRDNDSYTSFSTNTAGHTLSDYSVALEWVANRVSWLFINQYRDGGFNDGNLNNLTYDGLHPNNKGYEYYYKLWSRKFKEI